MSVSSSAAATGQRPRTAIVVASFALFTDMLIYGLAIPVLPLLPATVRAGHAATGVLFAAYAVAMIAVTPLAGRLVDRYGSRVPLLIGLGGLAAATLLFAVGGPYWLLLAARALQGVSAGMSWVASLSLIASVTPLQTRGRTMGFALSTISFGVLVGPPLAGFIVAHYGTHAPFLLGAASAVIDGILRIALIRAAPTANDDPAGPRVVLRVPGTVPVIASVVLGAGVIAAVEPVLPLHLAQSLQVGAQGTGLLFGLTVLIGVALNPVIGSRLGKTDARVLLGAGIVLGAAALVGLGLSEHIWQIAVAMGLLGAANAAVLSPATALIGLQGQRSTPPALGGAYALFNLAYAGGLMLGPILSGALTGAWSFTAAMSGLAVLVVLTGATSLRTLPTMVSGEEASPDNQQNDGRLEDQPNRIQ